MSVDKEPAKFTVEVAPARRPSLTQRLVGVNREWMQTYYNQHEQDDQSFGVGFNDQAEDFIPGVIENSRRRRNSSLSSDASIESLGGGRDRSNSIAERVAGMQVKTTPNTKAAETARHYHHHVGDISDYSILFWNLTPTIYFRSFDTTLTWLFFLKT